MASLTVAAFEESVARTIDMYRRARLHREREFSRGVSLRGKTYTDLEDVSFTVRMDDRTQRRYMRGRTFPSLHLWLGRIRRLFSRVPPAYAPHCDSAGQPLFSIEQQLRHACLVTEDRIESVFFSYDQGTWMALVYERPSTRDRVLAYAVPHTSETVFCPTVIDSVFRLGVWERDPAPSRQVSPDVVRWDEDVDPDVVAAVDLVRRNEAQLYRRARVVENVLTDGCTTLVRRAVAVAAIDGREAVWRDVSARIYQIGEVLDMAATVLEKYPADEFVPLADFVRRCDLYAATFAVARTHVDRALDELYAVVEDCRYRQSSAFAQRCRAGGVDPVAHILHTTDRRDPHARRS